MSNRVGTIRRKSSQKLRKNPSMKGKININKFMQSFSEGERVILKIDSTYQKGMYHPRFHGKSGVVVGMQGRCVKIAIMDGNKPKLMLAHPVHVKRSA